MKVQRLQVEGSETLLGQDRCVCGTRDGDARLEAETESRTPGRAEG